MPERRYLAVGGLLIEFLEDSLVTEYTKEELRTELAAIQGRLDEWTGIYDVDSRTELERSPTGSDADLSGNESREHDRVLRRWVRTLGIKNSSATPTGSTTT